MNFPLFPHFSFHMSPFCINYQWRISIKNRQTFVRAFVAAHSPRESQTHVTYWCPMQINMQRNTNYPGQLTRTFCSAFTNSGNINTWKAVPTRASFFVFNKTYVGDKKTCANFASNFFQFHSDLHTWGCEVRGREAGGGCRMAALKREANASRSKVLNDFRRSYLGSWFIRKSQFAPRVKTIYVYI